MKKIFSVVLALGMVLALSVVASPVAATVTTPTVDVAPDTVGTTANYTIRFNITTTLAIGDTISIEFPTGTTVPTSYETGAVTVQGTSISSGDIWGAGRVVTIRLPIGIGAITQVTAVFKQAAGIKNPAIPGSAYTVRVKTSQETTWVTSSTYTIRLADKSTYKFVYAVPPVIYVEEPAAVNVTLQTDVLGLAGYNATRITFNVTQAPGTSSVLFQVYNGTSWVPDTPMANNGTWPLSGNFSLDPDYTNTFLFRITFSKVGVYTIEFVLDGLGDGVLTKDEMTVAVTGTSVEITLNKGWNLISLPIVPDNKGIASVLAGIAGNFTSVHHYRAGPTKGWLIYAPPAFNNLTTMEDGKAYWINMKVAANLTVVGQTVAAPGDQGGLPPAYGVYEGWNMVGFRSMQDMKAEDYLKGTNYVRIYGFDVTQGGWFSLAPSQNMTRGLGYWVAFSEPGTIYP